MPGPKQPDTTEGLQEAVQPHYLGHRERARQRFLQAGEQALQDYELLELLLHLAIPRVDTKPIAKALLKRFGSFSAVLAASPERLTEVVGIKHAAAVNLKIIQAAAQRFGRDSVVKDMPILGLWTYGTPVADLSPLAGKSLNTLHCAGTKVKSLKGLPAAGVNVLRRARSPLSRRAPG